MAFADEHTAAKLAQGAAFMQGALSHYAGSGSCSHTL